MNDWIGRIIAWFALATVVVCFGGVFMRYVLSIGFIWVQDLYVWLHATVFVLGAGYTYLMGGHVRVDIFYARMSARGKAWVDLLGCIVFLMPWLIVLFVTSLPFVQLSWRLLEPSGQPGGMPGLFLLKTQILVFAVLLGLQGTAVMARSLLVLGGRMDFQPRASGH
ncbi:MAG: TRAP transporter small permease subunit [Alphaproteobacteria bacterium]|nr:TRAP transporter small permease subunit [Alphaproteobacteria bacterium]